jgi:hypothetical protein
MFTLLGSIFNTSENYKEVLNRVQEARKSTRTLNSLLCRKHISLNTKKQIFLRCGGERL